MESNGATPVLPPMEDASLVPVRRVALSMGRDVTLVRRRAIKAGCHLEKRWIADAGGARQAILMTDEAGEDALRRWFRR